jgi:hypothetical protein
VVDAGTGAGVAVAFARPELGARMIYALKDSDSAAKVSAALKRLDSDAALALANAQMEGSAVPFSFAFKKESVGKLAALHFTVTPNIKNMPQPLSDGFKTLFGKAVDLYWAVSGTRLLGTAGKLAKADLQKLATGKPGQPTGEVAQAIAAAKGKELIEYLDFAPLIAFGASLSKDPRAAAFGKVAQSPIPLVITSFGDKEGKGVTLELTFPPSAFSGAGTILQGMNGARTR